MQTKHRQSLGPTTWIFSALKQTRDEKGPRQKWEDHKDSPEAKKELFYKDWRFGEANSNRFKHPRINDIRDCGVL